MQIGSSSSSLPPQALQAPAASERAERGPDRDNDGDEGSKASAATTTALPTPPPGRGGKLDMLA